MVAAGTVRKDDNLFGNIYPVDEIPVDNEAPAKPDKTGAFLSELVNNQVFELAQLVRYNPLAVILRDNV